MAIHLRPAVKDDIPLILELIQELADYEKEPDAAVATAEDLKRDGFGAWPYFHVVLAETDIQQEGQTERVPVGFAFYFYTYSTWQGKPTLYLEDLFVRPTYRGLGAGKALLAELARVALANNCGRIHWQVLDWNTPAIEFYEAIGAKVLNEWLPCRVEGEGITELAKLA